MNKSPFPDVASNKMDYWILGICRDTSAITLFIVAPVLQFIFFRWLPFATLLALAILLLGHAMTGWRYFSPAILSIFTHPRTWPRAHRFLGATYAGFLGWATLSLLWTPLPLQGMTNIAMMVITPPIVLVLAHEHARAIAIPFPIIAGIGVVLIVILLTMELAGFTTLHKVVGPDGELWDLNRNAVLLALLVWPFFLLAKKTQWDLIVAAILWCAALIAVWYSQSEAAKLMLVIASCVWAVVSLVAKLYRIVFLGAAIIIVAFPLILDPLESTVSEMQSSFLSDSHAAHRIQIWKSYRPAIAERPIVGWGVRANRYFGLNVSKKYNLDEEKFDKKHSLKEVATQKGKSPSREELSPGQKGRIPYRHPHNVAIEFWVDYGLIGVLLASSVLVSLGRAASTSPANFRPVVACIFAACFSYSITGAAFMQGWWIGSMAMVVIALIATARSLSGNEPNSSHPWKRLLQKR